MAKSSHSAWTRIADWQASQRAAKRVKDQKREYKMGITSGIHDAGGLATDEKLSEAGCDDPSGYYLGLNQSASKFIFYPGTSLMCFGLQGVGKGARSVQAHLAHLGNDHSVFVMDFGSENYIVSADYRRDVLGQVVLACNPTGKYGVEGINLDPLHHIREAGRKKKFRMVVRFVREFVPTLLPEKPGNKDDGWVLKAARQLLITLLIFTALEAPELCSLPALYDLVSLPSVALVQYLIDHSRLKFIRKRLTVLIEDIKEKAGKQLHWKVETLVEILEPFERNTELGRTLLKPSFDIASMKSTPTTLYLQIPTTALEGYGSYIACVITSLVSQLAAAPGKQKISFLIDEASQLPPMKLGKWVRLHRKDGLAFATYWQSPSSIYAVYPKADADDLMECGAVKQYLYVGNIETARRLSERAGTVTVLGRNISRGADGRSATDAHNEMEKRVLPVAEILNLPKNEQLIEIAGLPLIRSFAPPWWEVEPYCNRLKKFEDCKERDTELDDDDDFMSDDFYIDDEDSSSPDEEPKSDDDDDVDWEDE